MASPPSPRSRWPAPTSLAGSMPTSRSPAIDPVAAAESINYGLNLSDDGILPLSQQQPPRRHQRAVLRRLGQVPQRPDRRHRLQQADHPPGEPLARPLPPDTGQRLDPRLIEPRSDSALKDQEGHKGPRSGVPLRDVRSGVFRVLVTERTQFEGIQDAIGCHILPIFPGRWVRFVNPGPGRRFASGRGRAGPAPGRPGPPPGRGPRIARPAPLRSDPGEARRGARAGRPVRSRSDRSRRFSTPFA